MDVRFDNRSSGTVWLDYRIPDHTFRFTLTAPGGATNEQLLREQPPQTLDARYEAPLRGHLEHQVVLNHFLQFDEVGAYSLTVDFRGRVEPRDPQAFLIAPVQRTFRIVVVPRDPDRLSRFCAAALAELRGPITPVRLFAAKRLAHVTDPIAVPYLRQAVELDLGYLSLWDGFLRIGTSEARNALAELARSANPAVANPARNALARFPAGG